MNDVLIIKGLEEIHENYDTFILDQWGVMHDGENGYAKAIKCVERLFLKDKNLIIISNSSKRKKSTINRLPSLSFNSKHFKEIMTSGEMIWQSLFNKNYKITKNLGKNCFYIYDKSKEDGKNFVKGLSGYEIIEDIEKADFILGCTPFVNSKVIDYVPLLEIALRKNIPFLCANPDYETVNTLEDDSNMFCMGTIAELYKNIGGKIFLLGKPSIDIYAESTKKIKGLKKSSILAIGDSLHHDIKGAINFGIDSLLITSTGIHNKIFDKNNINWNSSNSLLKNLDIKPTFICSELVF